MENFVTVSNANSKLGAQIYSINLPVGITCRPDAPCFKDCYARRGHWMYSNVQASLNKNYEHYKENPKLFFESVATQTALCKFVRWFSSGDIVDNAFFEGMCKVARKNRTTKYLCFTKKYEIVNAYIASGKKIPKNLSIVFSCWSDWVPENPYDMPTTWVYGKQFNNDRIPKTSIPCAGHCEKCLACWNLKKGGSVFFHKH